jgi:hypothetical protein
MRLLALIVLAGAVATAASASVLPGFKSPSGNIRCYAQPNVLHCDIGHADYATAAQNSCLNPNGEMGAGVDWHGFELSATRKGTLSCSGGALLTGSQHPRYVTLAYGHVRVLGIFRCASRVTGVTCTNRHGHGLFVSRQSWRGL